jgi:hypothetical protein
MVGFPDGRTKRSVEPMGSAAIGYLLDLDRYFWIFLPEIGETSLNSGLINQSKRHEILLRHYWGF